MSRDKVSVSYKNHNVTSTSLFNAILQNGEFSDVTLVCDDEKEIKAHKVILCAFSSFFRRIFHMLNAPQPVVYLSGISHKNLLSILEFIYRGEALIEERDLDLFLDSGTKFRVLGIFPEHNFEQQKLSNLSQLCSGVFSENDTFFRNKNPETSRNNFKNEVIVKASDALDQDGTEDDPSLVDPEKIANNLEVEIKVEPTDPVRQENIENNMPLQNPTEDKAMKEELIEELIEDKSNIQTEHEVNMSKVWRENSEYEGKMVKPTTPMQSSIKKQRNILKCEYCNFKSVQVLLLNKHKRIHGVGSSLNGMKNFTCNYCNTRFRSSQVLNEHKSKVHNVVRA